MNTTVSNSNTESTITCGYCGCIIDPESAIEFEGKYYCPEHIDEVSFICEDCGERKANDEENYACGNHICKECLEDNYAWCEQCEEYVPLDEINYCNDDNTYVCNDCIDHERGYFRCDYCGDIHSLRRCNRVYIDDDNHENWCDYCVESYANYCEECDRYFNCNTVSVIDNRCEYCEPINQECEDIRFWSAPKRVCSYSYKPDPCFCMTDEQHGKYNPIDLVHFGFELEMEDHQGYGKNADNDATYMNNMLGFTYCKHDGSLNDGIELVSHPATLEYLMQKKEVFAEVFKEMISRGYTSHDNGNCGLHIHISLHPFVAQTPYATSALIRIVDNLWDNLVRFSRRSKRQINKWAARYDTKDTEFKEIAKSVKKNNNRYTAVNVENRHTVEIRMFRGTLNVNTFFATLQMVKRLVDVSMNCYDGNDADSITWEKLIDCEYTELKEYCQRRFAVCADASDNTGSVAIHQQEQIPTDAKSLISENNMHLCNIHIGDTIRIDSHPTLECSEIYIGMTGTVSEIDIENGIIFCEDILSLSGTPLQIYPLHAYRTNTFRVGDYVRLRNNSTNSEGSICFTSQLEVGDIGIVRCLGYQEIGVEFQRIFSGHTLNNSINTNRGQYIGEKDLELI